MLADAQRTVRVKAPGELQPKLILFPHFTGIGLVGKFHGLALSLHSHAPDRLAEGKPLTGMRFLAHQIVPFAGVPHG